MTTGISGAATSAGITTDRVETVPGVAAAGPATVDDREPPACFRAPVDPASDEPADPPPRVADELSPDDDCEPVSANATTGATTEVPNAAVKTPAASQVWNCRSLRRC